MTDRFYEIFGWVLFILSSVGFMASSFRAQDWWALSGGVLFFVACLVFLYPYWRSRQKR